jgi:hypothetical protein
MKIKLDTTSNLVSIIGPLAGAAWWVWEWINPPKRWPGLRVLEFIGPAVGLLAILLVGFAIAAGLYRLTRLERGFNQDQTRRDKEFNTWLEQRGTKVGEDFDLKFRQSAYKGEQAAQDQEERFRDFYQRYNERLARVETRGGEGDLINVPYRHWIFQFTEVAHREYLAWDEEIRERIRAWCSQSGSRQIQILEVHWALGDFLHHNNRQWDFTELAALPEADRTAMLEADYALLTWYRRQAKLRDDGHRREL